MLDDVNAFVSTALSAAPGCRGEGVRAELILIPFPHPFEAVPCKPLLFDVARNAVRLPDLSAYRKQERRGLLSRIWGR